MRPDLSNQTQRYCSQKWSESKPGVGHLVIFLLRELQMLSVGVSHGGLGTFSLSFLIIE